MQDKMVRTTQINSTATLAGVGHPSYAIKKATEPPERPTLGPQRIREGKMSVTGGVLTVAA